MLPLTVDRSGASTEPARGPPALVDTHCHLVDARFDIDRDAVVRRARDAGVHHLIIIADTGPATEQAIALARRYAASATAGVHPHAASSWNDEVAARVAAALDDPVVVAVGETGLDYHYDHSPRDTQRRAFAAQLALGADRGKPVVVHAREADADIAAMLRDAQPHVPAIVLHSFSSGSEVWDAGTSVGAYFSFSGMVTFQNWKLSDAVIRCPADRILIETDSPYLAPHPHRGGRNEPSFVTHVAQRVAQLRNETVEDTARRTSDNAVRCFGARLTRSVNA